MRDNYRRTRLVSARLAEISTLVFVTLQYPVTCAITDGTVLPPSGCLHEYGLPLNGCRHHSTRVVPHVLFPEPWDGRSRNSRMTMGRPQMLRPSAPFESRFDRIVVMRPVQRMLGRSLMWGVRRLRPAIYTDADDRHCNPQTMGQHH